MKYSKEEVIQYVQEEDVKFIRLAFCDVFGKQKNISIMPERTFFVVRTFRLYSHLFKCQTYFTADIFASVFWGNIHIACVIIRLFGRVSIIIQSKQVKFLFSTKEEVESCVLGILNCFF